MIEKEELVAKIAAEINRDTEMIRFHREESISATHPDWLKKFNAELAAVFQESFESKMRLLNVLKQ